MKNKLIAGFITVLAVVAPVASAHAASVNSGTISMTATDTYLVVSDTSGFKVGDSFEISTVLAGTEVKATVSVAQIINPVMVSLNGTIPNSFDQSTVTITYPAQAFVFNPASTADNVKDFVTTKLLPPVTALTVLAISIALGLRVVKKFGKKLI